MPIEPLEDLQAYASPRTELDGEEVDDLPDPDPDDLIGVEFWPRAAARAIDYAYLAIVSSASGFLAGVLLAVLGATGAIPPGWAERIGDAGIGSMIVATVVLIVYHALCESVHGASFGKLCMKLRVVTTEGRRAGLGAMGLALSSAVAGAINTAYIVFSVLR